MKFKCKKERNIVTVKIERKWNWSAKKSEIKVTVKIERKWNWSEKKSATMINVEIGLKKERNNVEMERKKMKSERIPVCLKRAHIKLESN